MTALGGVALSDDLRLDGIESASGMAGSARPTLGSVCIQTMALSAGSKISLRASVDGDKINGYYTQEQVDAIGALRDAGEIITLLHHRGSYDVWMPTDAIDVTPVDDYADPDDDDIYVGTITMIMV